MEPFKSDYTTGSSLLILPLDQSFTNTIKNYDHVQEENIDNSNIQDRVEEFVRVILNGYPDQELHSLLYKTVTVLYQAYCRGFTRWIVTYSGGKDSTTVLVIAVEILKHADVLGWMPESIDIIFSDTLLELPPVLAQVNHLLKEVEEIASKYKLPLTIHKVMPALENRFWYKILAVGYPPPHNRFRWCTDRLKINPAESTIKKITKDGPTVLLTGVRYDESDARTAKINSACSRGGECGQGVWFERSNRLNTDYLAPIAEWRTCKIWDFLTWIAPIHEWSTASLAALYGSDPIRFGCWTCPLVKKDRATEAIVQRDEWAHLKPLQELRTLLINIGHSMNPDDRLLRPDGRVGKISLARRQQLYQEIKKLQQEVKIILLDPEEADAIENYWKSQECLSTIANSDRLKAQKLANPQ